MKRQSDNPEVSIAGARPKIFTVVLTGGIASGKTAVSDRFAALGVPVIDTDQIAHELVEPGQPALQQIAKTFGPKFMGSDGRLNRRKMRQAIFSDAKLKRRLEAILHPVIEAEAQRRVSAASGPYCILVVPLYAKSAHWRWIDRVLVVDVEEDIQIERVMTRDGIDREQAEAILAVQSERRQRLALANDIIHNSYSLEKLQEQVAELHNRYLHLSGNKPDRSN